MLENTILESAGTVNVVTYFPATARTSQTYKIVVAKRCCFNTANTEGLVGDSEDLAPRGIGRI